MNGTQFKPAWWLPGPHLQTLWPPLLRSKKKLPLTRERIELSDGDFVDLDWGPATAGPLVLILHGLEGSVDSPYSQGLLEACYQRGWRAGVMHFRGCSGEPNRLPRVYHSGDTKDVAEVVAFLAERYPSVPLAVVGVSMGGNILLKWLGETQKNNPIKASVAVSVPYDLEKAAGCINKGVSKLIYQSHFLRILRKKIDNKFKSQNPPFPIIWDGVTNMKEFDNRITAPLHGFLNASDYYRQASCRQYLKRIQIPTLLLHAKDDPLMCEDVIPTDSELSSAITLEVTEKGGHVGFVTGNIPGRPHYWLDERIPEFLQTYLEG